MTHRRSSAEWAKLIREFERSGQTAVAFASPRGIRPDTLKWWRWRLGREARTTKAASTPRPGTRVKLLSVEPVDDVAQGDRPTLTPVWELVAPSGYELRVYDRGGLGVLRAGYLQLLVTGVDDPPTGDDLRRDSTRQSALVVRSPCGDRAHGIGR